MAINEPYGYTLFCDDIRQEQFGKSSLIGVYKNELIVLGELPVKLPKLGFAIYYVQPYDMPMKSLTFKVFLPQDTPEHPTGQFEMKVEDEQMKMPLPGDRQPGDTPNQKIEIAVVMTDVQLEKEGRIRVRAYRDGAEIKCGTLHVRAQAPDAPTAQEQQTEAAENVS